MSVSPIAEHPLPRTQSPDVRDVRAFLADRLRHLRGRDVLGMIALPAPMVEPESLLRVGHPELGVLWDPPTGDSFAGIGAAWRFDLTGPNRVSQLQAASADLWPRLEVEAHETCPMPTPRLYGGLAFAVGAASARPWDEFGDGCFTLPRFGYGQGEETAWLSLTVAGQDVADAGSANRWIERTLALLQGLEVQNHATPLPLTPSGIRPSEQALERLSVERWVAQIEAIRDAIRSGSFEKIVAARRTGLELSRTPSASSVLRRLSRGLRASTRFAFCRSESTFLGATPERLIAQRGRRITTEALAGSIEAGGERAAQLLSSRKDLREHQLVVDEIVRRLEPLCSRLDVARDPQIRELRDVLHLLTPIVGELYRDRHVLELVEELHPTPAVGGVPTAEAVRWIVEHEAEPRGWYAAPIGWFDARGDGDFAVALRSCVLRGDRAYLYAGAGIVGDSDPLLEYTETELKEQALLSSLV